MGIKNLNRFLREQCSQSIQCINMEVLSGKRIAVDISIYMYKYEGENALLENIYLMLSIFMHYNIIPLFVFDGKPPSEKNDLLKQRKYDKKKAEEDYNNLSKELENKITYEEKHDILTIMEQLKKQFIYINKNKIENVKNLIRAFGATYYDAPGEADELCALLVSTKQVWACLSEDMDLFVYGCERVLRYFSLINHSVILYSTKSILDELKMSEEEFKTICIISGTDYNLNNNNKYKNTLQQTMSYFKKYKEENNNDDLIFHDWLTINTDYVQDIDLLKHIYKMFTLSYRHDKLSLFKNIKIINGPLKQDEIECIMKEENFIFCKK